MDNEEVFEVILILAATGHKGQRLRDGKPYITHPLHVAFQFDDLYTMALAVGHDYLEDVEGALQKMIEAGLPTRFMADLDLLTHYDYQSYPQYIDKIIWSERESVMRVKLGDLEHNMCPNRLNKEELSDKDHERLAKYTRSHFKITKSLELILELL